MQYLLFAETVFTLAPARAHHKCIVRRFVSPANVLCLIKDSFSRGRQSRQLAAMPNDLYLVRLIHQTTRRAFPGERLWTATQLVREPTIRFLRMRNREGCDIYIQPYSGSGNPGYILLDLDHGGPAALNLMRTHGLTPCVLLQT